MFENTNSIDIQDKIFLFKKHFTKIVLILIVIITLVFIIRSCAKSNYDKNKYTNLEQKMVSSMQQYTKEHTFELVDGEETYVDLYLLGIEPNADLNCSKSSGIVVANVNGQFVYTPYLICQDYESTLPGVINKQGDNNYITLKGANPMIINSTYEEPGYTVNYGYDVKKTGNVGNIPGLYTINYGVYKDNELKQSIDRVVVVGDYSNEDMITNPYPILTLEGPTNMTVNKNSTYTDPGYKAYDAVDRDITKKVNVLGTVDTSVASEYIITYKIANSRGRLTIQKRNVTVVDSSISPVNISITKSSNSLTSSNVKLMANISGNNYYYTLLPDNTKTFARSITYEVKANGTYTFMVYDHNYNVKQEKIVINNIDNKGPNAACVNKVDYTKSTITVTASDSSSGIAGYSFSNGGAYTSYLKNNRYTFNTANTNAYVKVKDNLGNTTYITCSLDPTSVINNNTKVTFSMDPVTPKTDLIPCGAGPSFNSALSAKVNAAGLQTRASVVQAAIYLSVDFPYKIPYFWAGKYEKTGLNAKWGCDQEIFASGNDRQPVGSIFPSGLDCTGFVSWAYANGGFSDAIIPRNSYGENMWGNWTPIAHTFAEIASNSQLLNSIKPGDIINGPGHAALIIGVDDTRLKVAQSSGGSNQKVNVIFVSKTTGASLDDSHKFTNIVFMDTFFEMYGK